MMINSINFKDIEKCKLIDILTNHQYLILKQVDLQNAFTEFFEIAPGFLNKYDKTHRSDHRYVREFPLSEIHELESLPKKLLLNIFNKYRSVAEVFSNQILRELLQEKNELIGQFENKLDYSLMAAYYFNCKAGAQLAPPHTDHGLFTFISGLQCQGLEILINNKTVKIEVNPFEIIVINGALIDWITNHKLKTTPHRVVGHGEQIRMTYPFFLRPPMNMEIIHKPLEPNQTIQFSRFCEKQKLIDQFNNYPFED